MVADIFYPIFILKITVLVCFLQKKLGTSPQPGHLPERPGGLTAPPIPQAAKKKNKKKTMRTYFSWIIPCLLLVILSFTWLTSLYSLVKLIKSRFYSAKLS